MEKQNSNPTLAEMQEAYNKGEFGNDFESKKKWMESRFTVKENDPVEEFMFVCADCGEPSIMSNYMLEIFKRNNSLLLCSACREKPKKDGKLPSKEFIQATRVFSGKMELADRFCKTQPVYYDSSGLWWLWSFENNCWEMTDEVDILNKIYFSLQGYNVIDSKERNEIIQALKQVGRLNKPLELKKTIIQFKNKLVDVETGEQMEVSPKYFAVNPIPYTLPENGLTDTPTMDIIFGQWVGQENVRKLYEIISYCILPDYPIHRLFCFIGAGMNGKSCFLRLIEKFIGKKNTCSTELDTLLISRFEVARLHKKLVCMMGETNFNELSKTSTLKKLTGQDTIGFEYKNKNPFDERNYAKILISTNNLPETTDKTDGFYRRWLIIDFPNKFTEAVDILATIPEQEFENLAGKSVKILSELLKNRQFYNEGSIADRQKAYEDKSNPIDKFMKENVEEDFSSEIPKWEFSKRLNEWCVQYRFREMGDMVIAKKMKEKGVSEVKPYKQWYDNGIEINRQVRCWGGLRWKN